ncbi:MAG: PIN domain-containing protein [Candidatus Buchananbacteria bacterium CG10_big_fil_rev_8_21_14_0_10_33_19]|uniref:PIN domain-containing protein n=1 Tax=Candidatus Buchananbacteria bacterium CG10_big_fil_rev_8_21_14_0_10_33_19 TaxID=1974525 RepID=A0A2H0W4A3_9BACT|nr:MAG: PIN domain-containing protein [Candidatus Buchananbacteria bacterium CG10_big_fil_rev_8_21_14_0_10_33_19]
MTGMKGLTTIFSLVEFPRALENGNSVIWPERRDYIKAIWLGEYLYDIGKPIQGIDLLIASIALNRNLILVTKDKHFERIPGLKFELIE